MNPAQSILIPINLKFYGTFQTEQSQQCSPVRCGSVLPKGSCTQEADKFLTNPYSIETPLQLCPDQLPLSSSNEADSEFSHFLSAFLRNLNPPQEAGGGRAEL